MTVEVLGTLLGTAIQGQIVGMANAPCIPGPYDIVELSNATMPAEPNATVATITLGQTVSVLTYAKR